MDIRVTVGADIAAESIQIDWHISRLIYAASAFTMKPVFVIGKVRAFSGSVRTFGCPIMSTAAAGVGLCTLTN